MSRLAFNSLAITNAQQKQYIRAFTKILDRGIYLRGPENIKLTELLYKKIGSYVTLVASGHDALLISLQSLNLNKNDEVVIPANAYPTAFAVVISGAKLVLADVNTNGQLDLDSVTAAITKNTKVVIMVHLYGATGDIESIRKLCNKHRITLIEDCAQAFGTKYKHKPVGTFGVFGCFSFYPTKNIGALGDGGAICSPSKARITQIQKLSFYGEKSRYKSVHIAGHSNLPELQAAGIQIALKNSEKNFIARKQVALWYKQSLKHLSPFIQPLQSEKASDSVPHLFVVRAKYRQALQKFLKKHHIPTYVHYPTPIHLVHAFSYLGYKSGSFRTAEMLSREIISLPFYPSMKKAQVQHVVDALTAFYSHSDTIK